MRYASLTRPFRSRIDERVSVPTDPHTRDASFDVVRAKQELFAVRDDVHAVRASFCDDASVSLATSWYDRLSAAEPAAVFLLTRVPFVDEAYQVLSGQVLYTFDRADTLVLERAACSASSFSVERERFGELQKQPLDVLVEQRARLDASHASHASWVSLARSRSLSVPSAPVCDGYAASRERHRSWDAEFADVLAQYRSYRSPAALSAHLRGLRASVRTGLLSGSLAVAAARSVYPEGLSRLSALERELSWVKDHASDAVRVRASVASWASRMRAIQEEVSAVQELSVPLLSRAADRDAPPVSRVQWFAGEEYAAGHEAAGAISAMVAERLSGLVSAVRDDLAVSPASVSAVAYLASRLQGHRSVLVAASYDAALSRYVTAADRLVPVMDGVLARYHETLRVAEQLQSLGSRGVPLRLRAAYASHPVLGPLLESLPDAAPRRSEKRFSLGVYVQQLASQLRPPSESVSRSLHALSWRHGDAPEDRLRRFASALDGVSGGSREREYVSLLAAGIRQFAVEDRRLDASAVAQALHAVDRYVAC